MFWINHTTRAQSHHKFEITRGNKVAYTAEITHDPAQRAWVYTMSTVDGDTVLHLTSKNIISIDDFETCLVQCALDIEEEKQVGQVVCDARVYVDYATRTEHARMLADPDGAELQRRLHLLKR